VLASTEQRYDSFQGSIEKPNWAVPFSTTTPVRHGKKGMKRPSCKIIRFSGTGRNVQTSLPVAASRQYACPSSDPKYSLPS